MLSCLGKLLLNISSAAKAEIAQVCGTKFPGVCVSRKYFDTLTRWKIRKNWLYVVNGLYLCSSANYVLNFWNIFCIVWALTYFRSNSPMGNFWLFLEFLVGMNLAISLIPTLVSDQESHSLKALCFLENRRDIWCMWYLQTQGETALESLHGTLLSMLSVWSTTFLHRGDRWKEWKARGKVFIQNETNRLSFALSHDF